MRKYRGLLKYLSPYKKNITGYLGFVILSIVFSVFSIAMLFPFLQLIFNSNNLVIVKPKIAFDSTSILNLLQYFISNIIIKHDKLFALASVCAFIVLSILLKNIFLYLSTYMMSPIRNGMMVQLRNDLYNKVLTLPIGYFTEQRKGDLMSRMTNDTFELEITVIVC